MNHLDSLLGVMAAALIASPLTTQAAVYQDATGFEAAYHPAASPQSAWIEPNILSSSAPSAWWMAFQESALDRLEAVALASSASWGAKQQAELARAYVKLRVQNLRLHNAVDLRQAMQVERRLRLAASPTQQAAQLLAALDARVLALDQDLNTLTQQRQAFLATLLDMTAADPVAAKQALAEALSQPELPAYAYAVPQRLPGYVLLSGLSISETSVATLLPLLSVSITADGAPDLPEFERGMDHSLKLAAQHTALHMQQLAQASSRAQAQAQRMEANRTELLAAQSQPTPDNANAARLLQAQQRFLVQADRFAQAQGELSLAWIALHSQAPLTISALSADPH